MSSHSRGKRKVIPRAAERVVDLGEVEILARLEGLLAPPEAALPPHVRTGLGDDAAVLAPSPGWEVVVSCDAMVEGVHFRREWLRPEEIGWRGLAVALSDLAAMAARPLGGLVALSLPGETPWSVLEDLYQGMLAAAREEGCPLLGGNLSRARRGLALAFTVLGEVEAGRGILRSGAKPGDGLWVTGELGGPGAVLRALRRGRTPASLRRSQAWTRFARPKPRIEAARFLRERVPVHASIDLSDGLARDAAHLARQSRVKLLIDPWALPILPRLIRGSRRGDLIRQVLHSGEEYELLFAAPTSAVGPILHAFQERFQIPLTQIGRVERGAGVFLLAKKGREIPLEHRGFEHFS